MVLCQGRGVNIKSISERKKAKFLYEMHGQGREREKKSAWVIKLIGFLKNALVSDVQHIQVLTRRY